MQTFLYVLGPFLLYAGLGIGAIIAALGFVMQVLIPKKREIEARVVRQQELQEYAHRASAVISKVIVNNDVAALAQHEQDEVFALRALPLHDKIASIPAKHRRAIGETS